MKEQDVVLALFSRTEAQPIGTPVSLAAEMMVFPAGKQKINATRNDAPLTVEVMVDQQTANAMQAALARHIAASPQKPYFDFNHEEDAASAWPTSFYWKDDGVYASVEWSGAGKTAVEEKTYRAFSPAFFIDDSTPARVTGAPFVMGGLVNDPAFRRIAPLWAKEAATTDTAPQGKPQTKTTTMTPEEIQAAAAKVAADKAAADAAVQAKNDNDALKAQLVTAKKNNASAIVQAAVARGAIKPEDTAVQAKWVDAIVANDAAKDLIDALPGKSAVILGANGSPIDGVISATPNGKEAVVLMAKASSAGDAGKIYAKHIRQLIVECGKRGELVGPMLHAITAANSNGSLAGDIIVLRALDLLKFNFPVLKQITTDFSDQNAYYGQNIKTRIITPPAVGTYNTSTGFADGSATSTDVTVALNAHQFVQLTFNANELASTARDLFGEQVEAMNYAMGKDLVEAVYALLTTTNYTNATTAATPTRATMVAMAEALNLRGVPKNRRTVLLNNSVFAGLINDTTITSLATFQKAEIITDYVLPNIAGMQPFEADDLPGNSVNLTGAAFSPDAIVLATRLPSDYASALPGANNGSVSTITNPDTGFSVLKTDFVNHTLGRATSRISWMRGQAAGQAASAQLLVSA